MTIPPEDKEDFETYCNAFERIMPVLQELPWDQAMSILCSLLANVISLADKPHEQDAMLAIVVQTTKDAISARDELVAGLEAEQAVKH